MTGSATLVAIVGDITTVEADAIVNAANNELWMGSGVAGAIKAAGGEEIEREAMAQGPIQVGEVVATGAGRLPYRAVIHAAAMGYEGGRMIPPAAATIQGATQAALAEADRLGLTSIAFPALGTGVGGFDLAEAAALIVAAARDYLAQPDARVRRVIFVLRNENARQTFQQAIDQSGAVA